MYILGKKTRVTKAQIKKLEKQHKMKAIDIYSKDDYKSKFCGPEEFISIISNSQFVVTDSFHGFAFSIIFGKPIIIVDRNADKIKSEYTMNSRIENLIDLMHLKNRNIDYLVNHPKLVYYSHYVSDDLKKLILDSKEYLKNILV